jgi:outer membrane immunogenic protein
MTFLARLGAAALALSATVVAGAAGAAPATWTGFYVGAVGSYAGGNTTAAFSAPTSSPDIRSWKALDMGLSGGMLGLTLGYNFDKQNNFMMGLEGDISWGKISGTGYMDPCSCSPGYVPYPTTGEFHQTYFGTLRARLGWENMAFNMPSLLYLTGGLAFSDGTRQIANTYRPHWTPAVQSHVGWTFGGGVETKFNDRWSWKAELLYADLGTQHYQSTDSTVITDVHLTDTLFRFGINKHF